MSAQDSSKHGPFRKPQADIFTVMLVLALVAIITACVFLYLETADYPDKPPWSGAKTAASNSRPYGGSMATLADVPSAAKQMVT